MKLPATPPSTPLSDLLSDEDVFAKAWANVDVARDRYFSWDRMRFHTPPAGLTHEQWWIATSFKRRGAARSLPLRQVDGTPFWFTLPDDALRALHDLAVRAGGAIGLREPVTNADTRNHYLVRGLMEEAITSSQLEGATTTRRVAKEMLRSGRQPSTKDERMIWNNYNAMRFVQEHREEDITPARVLELHEILVNGTLDEPEDAGRIQTPDEERIHVGTEDGLIVHESPAAETLEGRLAELCAFACGTTVEDYWLPPIARAIFVHFMTGHDHYFVDGNGRLARTLFYWVMLRENFWLTEFTTISTILKNAPVKYARAYLYSEQDGDLTHFLLYNLTVATRAFDALETYLERQTRTTEAFKRDIKSHQLGLNHRQVAILERAIHDTTLDLTMESHRNSHQVSLMTARSDLLGLENLGLLVRRKQGRAFHWWPTPHLDDALRDLVASRT